MKTKSIAPSGPDNAQSRHALLYLFLDAPNWLLFQLLVVRSDLEFVQQVFL